jgi:DNA repair protein RecO (recombination protein O)
VIGSHPLGEADRIVTFLTRSAGKVRAVAKGARKSKRRFGANLMLLSRVRLAWFESERRDLARLESADLLESFFDLQADPERFTVLACCAEVADAFAREEQEDEAFFRLLHAVLRAVRDGLDLDGAARYFELWTLRLHGFLPDLLTCARCGRSLRESGGRLSRREGIVVCPRCGARSAGDPELSREAIAEAARMMQKAPAGLIGAESAPAARAAIAALTQAMFFDITERRFRSYEVLERMRRP